MIRIIVFILAVAAAAAGFAWLADRPGELVLVWQGYRIETSLVAAGVMVAALTVLVMAAWTLLRVVLGLPSAFSGFLHNRRRARGYQALSKGMIAVGSGDARAAARHAEQARRALADEPLALLLAAQTAQLKGDRAAARRSFETMLDRPETELLGLRGLFVEAQRNADALAMRGYAERALVIEPATPWAAAALFDMQCAARDWEGALTSLERNRTYRLVDKATARRRRAVLLTAQALELAGEDRARAEALALEAFRLAGDLVPAAALAGRLLAERGNVRRAARLLERAWKAFPHPDIAAAYANIRAGDSTRDRLKRMKALAARTSGAREGAVAVAEAAIDARDWETARAALAPYLEERLTQHVCSLMAEIEEGEKGDAGRVRAWLARAVYAPRDATWMADGIVSGRWAPVSPVTGRLDAFEWKAPVESFQPARELAGTHGEEVAVLPGAAHKTVGRSETPLGPPRDRDDAPGEQEETGAPEPAAPGKAEPVAADAADRRAAAPEKSAAREPPQGKREAKAAPPSPPPAASGRAEKAKGGDGAAREEMAIPRAPDDPGPGGGFELDEEPARGPRR